MKTKILAVVLSLLVSGGAGLCVNSYAKCIGNTCNVKSASTCTQVKSAYSSGNYTGTSSACTNSTCVKGTASRTNSTCDKSTSSCTNSTCVKGTSSCTGSTCVNGTSSCANSACTNGTSSCTSSNCTKSSSKCNTSVYVQALSNCKNGTCNQNTICSILQCLKNGSCGQQSSTGASSSGSSSTVSSSPSSSSSGSTISDSSFSAYQNEVISLVNKERTSRGLKSLTKDSQLTKTATLKSEDMAKLNYFSHTSPTYGSPFDMMKQFGISYSTAGENIAEGQKTPEQVMQAWMNSSGHRANILNSSYTKIGVGIAKNSSGSLIWTQQFIG